MKQPIDNAVRQQALDPSQSFIVQAPAGSGKTELLIQRFLVLLDTVRQHPEEVLALTFTRKAASEMRDRIITALIAAQQQTECQPHQQQTRELALKVLAKDTEHDWQLIENPHRLKIMTLDALSATLVARMPVLSRLGGQASVVDNAAVLYEKAAFNTLTQTLDDEHYQHALQHLLRFCDNRLERCQRLLADLLAKREQWLPYFARQADPELYREQLETALQSAILDDIANAHRHFAAVPEAQRLCQQIGQSAAYLSLDEPGHAMAACADMQALPTATIEELPLWRGIAHALLTSGGQIRKTVNKKQGFPAASAFKTAEEKALWKAHKDEYIQRLISLGEHHALAEALQTITTLPQAEYTENQWAILDALFTVLPICAAQLTLIFQQHQQIDFVEISSAAIHALGQDDAPSELALALDNRICHLLVDEFQDTSRVHCELLTKLTEGWQIDDGRSLFVVGDPMQSIYRFRQARVDLFIQAKRFGLGNVPLTPLTLCTNFRSLPAVVNWNNQMFSTVFPAEDTPNTSAISYAASTAFHDEDASAKVVTHWLADEDANQNQHLLDTVREIQNDDPSLSIAVIVRSRSHLRDLLARCRQANLHYHATDIEPLAAQPAIQDCLALTFALDHLADRVSWLALLRAPWCGLSLKDMTHLAQFKTGACILSSLQAHHSIDALSADAQLRLSFCVPILTEAVQQSAYTSLSERVYRAWVSLSGPATLQKIDELDHCQSYFDRLREFEANHIHFDKDKFTQFIAAHYCAEPPSATDAPQPGIHVMTIHKSKGLEFDVVMLPGLERAPQMNQTQLLLWTERFDTDNQEQMLFAPMRSASDDRDPTYQYISNINKQKNIHETARLLYVACTRAKKQLHLIAYLPEGAQPRKQSLLSYLWPALTEIERESRVNKVTAAPRTAATPNILRRFHSAWYQQQPSTHSQQNMPVEQHYEAFNPQAKTAGIVGTFIHSLIELMGKNHLLIDKNNIGDYQQHWRQQLRAAGCASMDLTSALEKVTLAISLFSRSETKAWLQDPSHQSCEFEVALSYRRDAEADTQHYRLDCLLVDAQGQHWIIDFKTAEPAPGQSIDDFMLAQQQQYAQQLAYYAEVVAAMQADAKIRLALYFPLIDRFHYWVPAPVVTLG